MESNKKSFLAKPEYPGSMKAMSKFISENLVYPESAIANKIQGSVNLRIEINYLGKVKKVKIAKGLSEDCDKEASRLAKLLIFRVEKIHQLKVNYFRNINIHFKLHIVENVKLLQYNLTIKETKQIYSTKYEYKVRI